MTDRYRNTDLQTLHRTVFEAAASFTDVVTSTVEFSHRGDDDATMTLGIIGNDTFRVRPTRRAHGQLAAMASVPFGYYERLLQHHHELVDHTMNELFPDTRRLYRLRFPADGGLPIMRAALSDRYLPIDNGDVLTTVLKAFTDAGLGANDVQVLGDLDTNDGSLRVRCTVPAIAVNALELVNDYTHGGRSGVQYPMIFAGIEFSNSETGGGAFNIAPRAVLQVCTNGLTRDAFNFRRVHLGARLEQDGAVVWSDETRRKQLDLIASAARDAITQFMSPSFLRTLVNDALIAKGKPVVDVEASHGAVVKFAQLSDDEARSVLNAFVQGGALTQLGWAHALTAVAQTVDESDRQAELEAQFWPLVTTNALAGIA